MTKPDPEDMVDIEIMDLTPENIADYGVCGYKDVKKHIELRKKIDWFREYYPKGLRIKILLSKEGGYQGMLEYIPGRYAHRPVDAEGYMFIHCVFVGFSGIGSRKHTVSCGLPLRYAIPFGHPLCSRIHFVHSCALGW